MDYTQSVTQSVSTILLLFWIGKKEVPRVSDYPSLLEFVCVHSCSQRHTYPLPHCPVLSGETSTFPTTLTFP